MHKKPGRDLGYTRYDKVADASGCYAQYLEEPEGIRPALQRAWRRVEEGMVGFVNVKTDYRARAPRRCASPAAKPEQAFPTPQSPGQARGGRVRGQRDASRRPWFQYRESNQRTRSSRSEATFQSSTLVWTGMGTVDPSRGETTSRI